MGVEKPAFDIKHFEQMFADRNGELKNIIERFRREKHSKKHLNNYSEVETGINQEMPETRSDTLV